MKSITVPADRRQYPSVADESVMAVRMKLGDSRLSVSYRLVPGGIMPVVAADFYSEKGKLYTLHYHLPPDTPERTDRRVSRCVSSRGTRIDSAILANFGEPIVSGFRTGIVSGVEVLTRV